MKRILITFLTLGSYTAHAEGVVEDIRELIPEAYLDVEVVEQNDLFPDENNGVAAAKCRGGLRIGDSLGRNFASRLSPSCDELLFPIMGGEENEWSIPNISFAETSKPATVCSYLGFARAFEQTVLNTSLNCA